jgi:integrase
MSKLAPTINEYLEMRKALGYSDCQEIHLASFDTYCREHHPDLETLTRESVRGWVSYEISCGRNSMYRKIGSIRMLAQYLGGGAYILPTNAVAKAPVCTPYILTDDELSRLFFAVDNIQGKTDSSLKAMFPTLIRLLYTCGLRPTEGRLIKRKNIDFTTGEILVEKSKAHKERIVVMSDDMLRQCREYDIIRTIISPESEYFFVRKDGKPVPTYHLCVVFTNCWRRANPNIPENMLPRLRAYDLRHRFASTILQKWIGEGRDLYAMLPYLQAYMGHEMFEDTAYYIHLLPENLLNSTGVDWSAIDAVNPEVTIWKN